MQASNLEPRRSWKDHRARNLRSPWSELEHSMEQCRTCGVETPLGEWRGEWFCRECLDRASQRFLDPEYDDLGGPG